MGQELIQIMKLLSDDDRVKAVVVTGHGKSFCVGADLTIGFPVPTNTIKSHRDSGGEVALAIYNCTKPVIGAINGSAVGVGITMTLPMTIRVASNKAKVGFVFARRGIVMEAASCFFLPRLVGYSKAMHLVSTGAVYPSTHSLVSDLFTEILDPEQVVPRALELANEIAKNTSTVSVCMNKELIWRGPNSPEGAHLVTSKIIRELFTSNDNKEGVRSFMEKRPPQFQDTLNRHAPTSWPWWTPVETRSML
jgi:enoyl-CoA hydratase/carnithine racemase